MRTASLLAVTALAGLVAQGRVAQAQFGGTSAAAPQVSGGLLPGFGGGSRVGDLRPQLERYFQPSLLPATAPTWVIRPSIGVDVGYTDNARRVSTGGKSDVFTIISPAVSVTGDSARVKTNLIYSPQLSVYASTPNQTQFSQFANGQTLITVAPDAVFLDLRGAITQSSLIGSGFDNGNTETFNRQNQVQTTSFSITPYATQRFGGWGTGTIGYSFARTLQDRADDSRAFNQNNTFNTFGNGQGYGSIGNLTTQRERASFVSGENLGRINDMLTLEAIQYGGSGSYSGSHRNQVLNEVGYAVTRRFTVLGGLGYQDILYKGGGGFGVSQPDVRINEPTWNVGGRYSPGPDSTVTVLYGRRDGSASVSVDGQFSPTARTRLVGRYSTGISSDIEDAQNLLETTSVGPTGLLTDRATGAPVSGGIGVFGIQNGVFRVRRLSVVGYYLADRDTYSVSIGQEDRTTLTTTTSFLNNNVVPAGTKTSNLFGSVTWQHDLSPGLTSSVSAQYATSNNEQRLLRGSNSRQDTYSISGSLAKQFTETLSGSARFVHSERSGGGQNNFNNNSLFRGNAGDYSENVLLVGVRKSF